MYDNALSIRITYQHDTWEMSLDNYKRHSKSTYKELMNVSKLPSLEEELDIKCYTRC